MSGGTSGLALYQHFPSYFSMSVPVQGPGQHLDDQGLGEGSGSLYPLASLKRQAKPSLSLSPQSCLFSFLFPSNLLPRGPCLTHSQLLTSLVPPPFPSWPQ